MHKLIKRSNVDWNTRHVTIEIYEDAFSLLWVHLLGVFEKKHRKSLLNTIRLYLFLRVMNECKVTHIAKEDLACMFFSKHTERLNQPLCYLIKANLLEIQENWNSIKHHNYYTYITKGLDVKVGDKNKTRCFEMDIPEHVECYLKRPPQQSNIVNTVSRNDANTSSIV